jgi:hypothetical protein
MNGFTRIAGALLLLAGALFAPAVQADSLLDFSVENQTGFTLKELYVSPGKKDTWGKNILKSPMKDGDTRKISFKPHAKIQSYDVMAVYADGGKPIWYDIEPANISKVTLKWDKQARKTILVKHR